MSTPAPSTAIESHSSLLRRAEHVLFLALLLVGTVRTIIQDRSPLPASALAVAVLVWYLLGIGLERRPNLRRLGPAWLLLLALGWVGLVALTVDFVWLAFVLFLLAMQLLPLAAGVPSVLALLAVGVTGLGWHRGGLDVPSVLGPVCGAAVAVVIVLVYRELRREADRRARLLQELTAAQSRMAAAERRSGGLAERERLAREIHDTVTQSLSTIVLLLRSSAASWAEAPEPTREQLDAALAGARSALEDTRRLIHALEPAELEGQPLNAALERVTADARRNGLDARFITDGDPYPVPTAVDVVLLRVAQEALANVRRHAEAGRVTVTVTFLPDAVRLDVVDDGRGFAPTNRPSARGGPTTRIETVDTETVDIASDGGVGLRTMRERLREVGGTLVVESTPDHGTAVSASVPAPDGGDDQARGRAAGSEIRPAGPEQSEPDEPAGRAGSAGPGEPGEPGEPDRQDGGPPRKQEGS